VEVELQAAMERRGLTQGQAASELGVSQKTVSVWLRGDRPPSRGESREDSGVDRQGVRYTLLVTLAPPFIPSKSLFLERNIRKMIRVSISYACAQDLSKVFQDLPGEERLPGGSLSFSGRDKRESTPSLSPHLVDPQKKPSRGKGGPSHPWGLGLKRMDSPGSSSWTSSSW
jgi:hypothetical protein